MLTGEVHGIEVVWAFPPVLKAGVPGTSCATPQVPPEPGTRAAARALAAPPRGLASAPDDLARADVATATATAAAADKATDLNNALWPVMMILSRHGHAPASLMRRLASQDANEPFAE